MHTAQINGKRPGGTGHGPNGRISPRLESPSSPCGWEQRHAAHGSRIPPPRTDQKTSSTKHTLPRISLKLGGQPGVPRGSQGSERLLGYGWPGPLTPYVGDSRPEQRVAAGTAGRRYLCSLCEKLRGYHHDSTQRIPLSDARSQNGFKSATTFTRASLYKRYTHGELSRRTTENFTMK